MGLVLLRMYNQHCLLGYFQLSLRDWSRSCWVGWRIFDKSCPKSVDRTRRNFVALPVKGKSPGASCASNRNWKVIILQPLEGYFIPKVVWPGSVSAWHSLPTMRVNIKARIPMHLYQEFHSLPLVLTIETAHGLAARCEHRTTAAQLMWTLD